MAVTRALLSFNLSNDTVFELKIDIAAKIRK